jgi:hypothetical protein
MTNESTITVADGSELFKAPPEFGAAQRAHMADDEPEGKVGGASDRQRKRTGEEKD